MKTTSRRNQYTAVLATTIVAVVIYLICYRINIVQPISVDKDKATDNFIRIAAIDSSSIQTGILGICEYNIQNILMFFIIKICGNVWTGINIYYVLTFFMISFSMYHFLTRLEIPAPLSVGLAVLSAFMPFHVDRGEGQMMTSNFFLAPLFLEMFYDLIYCRETSSYKKRYLVLVCLAPFIDVRISVMACILFIIFLIQRPEKKFVKYAFGYFVPLLMFTGFIGAIASTMKTSDIETAKAEGMRILDMVMPMRYHVLDRLSNMRYDYDVLLSANGESGLNSLGILFTLGFVCMMLGLFFEWKNDKRIAWMGMISMFVILTAGVCGLGSVFEYMGLRVLYWNRMAIFIIVCSIATLGILLGNICKSIENKFGRKALAANYAILYIMYIFEFFELILRQNM